MDTSFIVIISQINNTYWILPVKGKTYIIAMIGSQTTVQILVRSTLLITTEH